MTRAFLTLGMVMILAGVAWLGVTIAWVAAATRTEGVVVRIDREISDTGPVYWPTFRFADAQGRPIERRFSVGVGDGHGFAVGDPVHVLYGGDDGRFVRIDDPVQLYLKPVLPILAGIITWYLAWSASKAVRNGRVS